MLLDKKICMEAQKIFYGENTFAFLGMSKILIHKSYVNDLRYC